MKEKNQFALMCELVDAIGPGISPWHMKKKKVYLYKKGNCLCLIITIHWICEKSVLKFQKNCEEVLNKIEKSLT